MNDVDSRKGVDHPAIGAMPVAPGTTCALFAADPKDDWSVPLSRLHSRLGLVAAPIALILSTACSQAAPAPPPAAAPVSTAASPSPVAAAATALASPVATAVAAASPLASPIATAVAAASPAIASVPVQIAGVQLNPTDPTLTLRNSGAAPVSLSGWRLQVGSTMATMPSSAQIGSSGSLTVHLTSGTNSATDLYLGADGAALLTGLQPGARVALMNAQSEVVNEFTIPRL